MSRDKALTLASEGALVRYPISLGTCLPLSLTPLDLNNNDSKKYNLIEFSKNKNPRWSSGYE